MKKLAAFVLFALACSTSTLDGIDMGEADAATINGGVTIKGGVSYSASPMTSITASPSAPSMTVGTTQQLTVTGHFSSGATNNVTSLCSYSSSDATIASVTSGGLVSALGNGGQSATITINYGTAFSTTSSITTVALTPNVFVIAGQSNAVGQGPLQTITVPGGCLTPKMYGGDYTLATAVDPIGFQSGWIDAVNNNGAGAHGTPWAGGFSSSWLGDSGAGGNCHRQLTFIPTALNASRIAAWVPGSNHQDTTTLYGAMVHRAIQSGLTITAVIWFDGEGDIVDGTPTATVQSKLNTIANAVNADLGCKLYPTLIQASSDGAAEANRLAFNTAISACCSGSPPSACNGGNIGTCIDLSDLTGDVQQHFTTNGSMSTVGMRFYNVMKP